MYCRAGQGRAGQGGSFCLFACFNGRGGGLWPVDLWTVGCFVLVKVTMPLSARTRGIIIIASRVAVAVVCVCSGLSSGTFRVTVDFPRFFKLEP